MRKKIDNELNIDIEELKKRTEKTKKIAKKTVNEYKDFAMKSSIIDLAIGMVIGSAFTNIVNSLVTNLITPLLSSVTSKVDLSSLFIALNGKTYQSIDEAKKAGAIIIGYGSILNAVINFFIISFCLFIVFKYINKIKRRSESTEEVVKKETTKVCPYCLSSIPLEAKKCAHCTSDLTNDLEKTD